MTEYILTEEAIEKLADEVIEDFKELANNNTKRRQGYYIGRKQVGVFRYFIDKAIKRAAKENENNL